MIIFLTIMSFLLFFPHDGAVQEVGAHAAIFFRCVDSQKTILARFQPTLQSIENDNL